MTGIEQQSASVAANGVRKRIDYWLLFAALMLAAFGLMMVLSSSGIMAERYFSGKYHFFKKQAVFAAIGVAVMVACARIPRGAF